jgi:hypothetical protein
LTDAERWAINKQFLDEAIARGDEILLASPESAARAGTFLARELAYLRSLGYEISKDGTRMIKCPP